MAKVGKAVNIGTPIAGMIVNLGAGGADALIQTLGGVTPGEAVEINYTDATVKGATPAGFKCRTATADANVYGVAVINGDFVMDIGGTVAGQEGLTAVAPIGCGADVWVENSVTNLGTGAATTSVNGRYTINKDGKLADLAGTEGAAGDTASNHVTLLSSPVDGYKWVKVGTGVELQPAKLVKVRL